MCNKLPPGSKTPTKKHRRALNPWLRMESDLGTHLHSLDPAGKDTMAQF